MADEFDKLLRQYNDAEISEAEFKERTAQLREGGANGDANANGNAARNEIPRDVLQRREEIINRTALGAGLLDEGKKITTELIQTDPRLGMMVNTMRQFERDPRMATDATFREYEEVMEEIAAATVKNIQEFIGEEGNEADEGDGEDTIVIGPENDSAVGQGSGEAPEADQEDKGEAALRKLANGEWPGWEHLPLLTQRNEEDSGIMQTPEISKHFAEQETEGISPSG